MVNEPQKAISELRETVRLNPNHAEAHCNLGLMLADQGRYREALPEVRQGHALGSRRPGWLYPSARWIKRIEEEAALDERLPAIVRGQVKPADEEEGLRWALFCRNVRQYHFTATGLFAAAFTARPALMENSSGNVRFQAACSAAEAGCGVGADSVGTSDAERLRCRQRALEWLRADLDQLSKRMGQSGATRTAARNLVSAWKTAPSLAPVRQAERIAKLPEAEQAGWTKLWREVDRLLAEKE